MRPIALQTRVDKAWLRRREFASPWATYPSRCRSVLLALGLALGAGQSAALGQSEAAAGADREYTIKAAYLYNFGRYIEWPETAFRDSAGVFVIGVLGTDPFGAVLDEIAATKKIEGRRIVARRFSSMAQYVPCEILFVPASATPEQRTAAIRKSQETHVLLVGETPGFSADGAVVNFFVEENKVRFEINAEAAKRRDLKISSKLLTLAKLVGGP